ncbi:MAG: alpha/beta family hydrolase [Thermoanaerobaculia bacterium]|nr:alpha/beta family hydrolase [Thermoanaerobaculia bacterium]
MNLLFDGPRGATSRVVLAHGAGAGMDHPFMTAVAEGLAERGLRVARFEFPYMERRRAEGKRYGPDRPRVLLERWREVIGALSKPGRRLVIGGKSMGGRIASMVADETGVDGLVCLGYPFHPPGRPEKLRVAHLEDLATPTLILQGERDPFGGRDEVAGYRLSRAIRVEWLPDGDHSLKPRKASGRTHQENLGRAIALAAEFAAG